MPTFPLRALLFLCMLTLALSWPRPGRAAGAPLPNGTPTIITSDGVKLFTKISGQGLPCVFVHGGPGAWSGMPEQFIGPAVQERLQMIWFDQRGSGRSQNDPNKNYSLDRMVQDMEELRQQLGVERWVVMAHSFGGTIATAYAARYPARVHGLALLNCTLSIEQAMRSTLTGALPYLNLPATEQAALRDEARPIDQRFAQLMPLMRPEVWQKLQYTTQAGHDQVTAADQGNPGTGEFGGYGFSLPDYRQDFTRLTPQITAPVLVITGKTDFCVGPEHYQSFRFPHQRVVQLATGHVPFVEEPAAFRAALTRWIATLPRPAKA